MIFKWRNWLIYLRYLHVPESSEQPLAEIAYHIQLIGTMEKKRQLFGKKDSGPAEFSGRFVDRILMEELAKEQRWFYCGSFVAFSLGDTLNWFWFFYPALETEKMVALVREDVAMSGSRNGYVSGQERLAWWVHEIYEAGREEVLGEKRDLEKGEGV